MPSEDCDLRFSPMTRPSIGLAFCSLLVCNLALPAFPEKPRIPFSAGIALRPAALFEDCTAMALPITGQRLAMVCKFDMLPPPGEAW